MKYIVSTSKVYTADEHASWLEQARFHDVQVVRPPMGPGTVLISGRKERASPSTSVP